MRCVVPLMTQRLHDSLSNVTRILPNVNAHDRKWYGTIATQLCFASHYIRMVGIENFTEKHM
jgi:hypothetical protein